MALVLFSLLGTPLSLVVKLYLLSLIMINMPLPVPVPNGVLQGSILGPLLFLLYTNDVPDILQDGVGIKIYSDDTKLFFSLCNMMMLTQACLDFMTQLNIAFNKCSTISFGNLHISPIQLCLLEFPLEVVSTI